VGAFVWGGAVGVGGGWFVWVTCGGGGVWLPWAVGGRGGVGGGPKKPNKKKNPPHKQTQTKTPRGLGGGFGVLGGFFGGGGFWLRGGGLGLWGGCFGLGGVGWLGGGFWWGFCVGGGGCWGGGVWGGGCGGRGLTLSLFVFFTPAYKTVLREDNRHPSIELPF